VRRHQYKPSSNIRDLARVKLLCNGDEIDYETKKEGEKGFVNAVSSTLTCKR
jgi:hypothetical protein